MIKKHTNQPPLISVIMPVFNAEKFLVEAIESVLAQTYPNWELILVDDKSTDRSWKIIESYVAAYPERIVAKRLKVNRNSGGDWAANEAYKMARGEFIARTDADDVMYPKRLEKQLEYMLKHPDLAVLGTCADVIDSEGKIIGKKMQPTSFEAIYKQYAINHPMINPSLMLRRSQLSSKKELYSHRFPHNNDLFTFFTMITKGKQFANLPQRLIQYRIHGNNDSLKYFKQCFWNTLKIRLEAVLWMGYKPTPKAIVHNLIQIAVALVLPEPLIRTLYLVMRGMKQVRLKKSRQTLPVRLLKLVTVGTGE